MKTIVLRVTWFLICVSTFTYSLPAHENDLPTRTPSPSATATTKRFVEECVTVSPGKPGFPIRSLVGTKEPTENELPQQEVTINRPFRISKYETTQELYEAVVGNNPSRWKGPRNSVENVNWSEAMQFCKQLTTLLNEQSLISDHEEVRLPTYIEWEYCCRAGSQTRYYFGQKAGTDGSTSDLDIHAWHTGNAAGNDPAVGVLKPNSWGLFDVHGYLWEYVDHKSTGKTLQISAPPGHCLVRGGSWRDAHPLLSSSAYLTFSESHRSDAIGFRCVIAEKPEVKIAPMR